MNNRINIVFLVIFFLFSSIIHAKTTIFSFNNTTEQYDNSLSTDHSREYEKNITRVKGACSQKMSDVRAERDVIQRCTIYVKNIQINSIEKLRAIKERSKSIAEKISYLEGASRKNNSAMVKTIASLKKELRDVQDNYYLQKIEAIKLEQKSSYLEYQQKSNRNDILFIKENNQKIRKQIVEIDASISSNKLSIGLIQDKVEIIESDVAVLMNEYANGNLTEVSFYGANVGAEKIEGVNYSTLGLEYERLMTLGGKKISLLGEFKKFRGKKKYNYKTLNGLDDIKSSEESTFYAVGLGSRLFFNQRKNFQNYIGSTAGITWGDEKNYYVKFLTGVEIYQKFNKLSLDLSYSHYSKMKDKKIKFSATGATKPQFLENSANGLALTFKFSTR